MSTCKWCHCKPARHCDDPYCPIPERPRKLNLNKPVTLNGLHNSLCVGKQGNVLRRVSREWLLVDWPDLGFANLWLESDLKNA